MLLPFRVSGKTWLLTPTEGTEITSSDCPKVFLRTVPFHVALAGKAAGQPAPLTMVPAQLPKRGSLAACVNRACWPATDSVAVRASPEFSVTVTLTVPLPVPAEPDVMVANVALDEAVQPHPAAVTTPTETAPPVLAMLSAVLDRL